MREGKLRLLRDDPRRPGPASPQCSRTRGRPTCPRPPTGAPHVNNACRDIPRFDSRRVIAMVRRRLRGSDAARRINRKRTERTMRSEGAAAPAPADSTRHALTVAVGGLPYLPAPTRWACRSSLCQVCFAPAVSGAVRNVNDPPVPQSAGEVLPYGCQPDGPILDM
jgi:hypothetical protein